MLATDVRRAALLVAVASGSLQRPALAQSRDPADLALAETLFRDAKKAMDEGQFKDACPKLAESHRLDPAGGTVLLLGLCLEGAKQWASAWTAFNDAVALAIKDGRRDREQRAKERLAVVEPLVAKVSLLVPASLAATAGLRIARDGKELPRAAWSVALPLDPGPHALEASAPGHKPFRVTVTLPERGVTETVKLPDALEPEAAAPPATSAAPPPPAASASVAPPPATTRATSGGSSRSLAYGLMGVGAVGLGVGAYFGLRAISRAHDANDRCPDTACGDRGAVEAADGARKDARIANVAVGLGLVAAAAGVVLVLREPSRERAARLRWSLDPAPNGAVTSLGGRF